MLLKRIDLLRGTTTDISPIHWRHGALARLSKDDTIDSLLGDGYASISLGYVGLHECVQALGGGTHTSKKGEKMALDIMNMLRAKTEFHKWHIRFPCNIGEYTPHYRQYALHDKKHCTMDYRHTQLNQEEP